MMISSAHSNDRAPIIRAALTSWFLVFFKTVQIFSLSVIFFFSGVWKSRCALVLWPNDTTLATVIDFRCRWLCTRCLIARFVLHPEQKPATINRPNNKSQNSDTCFTTAAAIKHAPHTTSTAHTVSGRMTKIPAIDPHRRRVRRHLKLSAAAAWPFKRRRLVHPPGALLSTAPALCSLHRRFFLFL